MAISYLMIDFVELCSCSVNESTCLGNRIRGDLNNRFHRLTQMDDETEDGSRLLRSNLV